MAHGSSVRRFENASEEPRSAAHPRLFKSDHPRAIDRYIDYFEGTPPFHAEPEGGDACGEGFLERLA
jgi:hypothetical protein